jgi:biopolymer transport protein TolR
MSIPEQRPRLSAAARGKIRRLSQARALAPDAGGELNVVPFLDVIVNVMIFVLATLAVTFTSAITLPAAKKTGLHGALRTGPTIFVVGEGFAIKTADGNIASGCEGTGSGIAIPRRGEALDYAGLSSCLLKLKHASEELAALDQAFITANPGVDYQTIVSTTDAVRRGPGGEPLFSEINLRVPR